MDAAPFFENYGKLYFDARHLATKEIEHGVVKCLMPFLANILDASLIFYISPWYVRLLVSIFLVQFLYLQIWIWLDAIKAHTGNLTSTALQNCLSSDAISASIIHEMELKRAHFFVILSSLMAFTLSLVLKP